MDERKGNRVDRESERGTLYGVGVGPGDPELLTLKAKRLFEQADIVAVPASPDGSSTAYGIIRDVVVGKTVERYELPMTRDRAAVGAAVQRAADRICAHLACGRSVAFATLGDPTLYSTYGYIHEAVKGRGYETVIVPGITSVSACAARLGAPLAENDEPIIIAPVQSTACARLLAEPAVRVVMKAGHAIPRVLKQLEDQGELDRACMVERCGMEGERVVRGLDGAVGDGTGYFAVVIVPSPERGETASNE